MKRNLIALLAVASLGIATFVVTPAAAQDKMGGKMSGGKMSGGKMSGGKMDMKSVYVCKMCKAYYPAASAKMMGYKDPMGHKLVKMAKAPVGYTNGSKMKMHDGDKMGGKMGGKMDGGKM